VAQTQRIRRKDLRQPDEFVTLSRQAVNYVEANRTTVLLIVGSLVLLLAAILVFRAVRASREASAAQAYVQAHALLDDKKYPEAATAFQQISDGYGSSGYADLALLEAANALMLAGRAAEAAVAYQKVLDANPATDYLRQLALVRLGAAEEQSDKPAEAARTYASAVDLQGPYGDEALAGQARLAEASGDTATAKDLYARFLQKYPESDRVALVTARLVALGAPPSRDTAAAPAAAGGAAAAAE
jgi:predicted negative regulator of RcsB-dependent stress response